MNAMTIPSPVPSSTLPGFDEPLAFLAACHQRVLRAIDTLERLLPHLASRGVDADAMTAAQAVLRYFDEAAPLHHADEESDLFPVLLARAEQPDDRATAFDLTARLMVEHRGFTRCWSDIRGPLAEVAAGRTATIDAAAATGLVDGYRGHVAREDAALPGLVARLLTPDDLARIGAAMARRRGVPHGATAPGSA